MLHIISKQVTCETTEVLLCAGTVVEAKVRAVKTGLCLGARVPEGISIVIQSVAWEYSGYPCLSLHLQNIYHVSEITMPPSSYNEHFLLFWDLFYIYIMFINVHVCMWMYILQQVQFVQVASGVWALGIKLRCNAKHLYPLNCLNSPSSSNCLSSSNYNHCSFTCPVSQYGLIINFSTWQSDPLYESFKSTPQRPKTRLVTFLSTPIF